MTRKYDELAGRLADRLTAAPSRGHTAERSLDDAATSAALSRERQPSRTAANDSAAPVRRAHLVPADLHVAARRRKTLDGSGTRVTWTDVVVDGVARLVDHVDPASVVTALPRRDGAKRLVQATLPAELDRRFVECHLDLNDLPGENVTFEAMWAAAITLWLER